MKTRHGIRPGQTVTFEATSDASLHYTKQNTAAHTIRLMENCAQKSVQFRLACLPP